MTIFTFNQLMMQEWEGRFNMSMSNSVTTAIRGSVREMAIGKTRTTEKADRATVEQVTLNCSKFLLTSLDYQKNYLYFSFFIFFVHFVFKVKSFLVGCFIFIFWCLLALGCY